MRKIDQKSTGSIYNITTTKSLETKKDALSCIIGCITKDDIAYITDGTNNFVFKNGVMRRQ